MILDKLNDFSPVIEAKLKEALENEMPIYNGHFKAMEYSLLAGGKRLRPFILNEFYKAAGGNDLNCLNFAAALEMIHTYSLIHDDLPAMDNDDMRRGKPSCHKAFGESTALLAGDGLLTGAFLFAAKTKNIPSDRVLKAIEFLAELAGNEGMIGGQVIDLAIEKGSPDLETVTDMYKRKTGCLLVAAAKIGTLLAGGNGEMLNAAENYGYNLGLAFQIQDDILDALGDEQVLGKPTGSDHKNSKATYFSLVGENNAREDILRFTNKAKSALKIFGDRGNTLLELADFLINRKY